MREELQSFHRPHSLLPHVHLIKSPAFAYGVVSRKAICRTRIEFFLLRAEPHGLSRYLDTGISGQWLPTCPFSILRLSESLEGHLSCQSAQLIAGSIKMLKNYVQDAVQK